MDACAKNLGGLMCMQEVYQQISRVYIYNNKVWVNQEKNRLQESASENQVPNSFWRYSCVRHKTFVRANVNPKPLCKFSETGSRTLKGTSSIGTNCIRQSGTEHHQTNKLGKQKIMHKYTKAEHIYHTFSIFSAGNFIVNVCSCVSQYLPLDYSAHCGKMSNSTIQA